VGGNPVQCIDLCTFCRLLLLSLSELEPTTLHNKKKRSREGGNTGVGRGDTKEERRKEKWQGERRER
jgi:hypothetical protein